MKESVEVQLTAYYVKELWWSRRQGRRSSFILHSRLEIINERQTWRAEMRQTKKLHEALNVESNSKFTVHLIVQLSEGSLWLHKHQNLVPVAPYAFFSLYKRLIILCKTFPVNVLNIGLVNNLELMWWHTMLLNMCRECGGTHH